MASRHTKQPTYTKQSIYEEIQKTGLKGKIFSSEKKKSLAEELIREGKVRKIGEKYYSSDIDLSSIDPKRTIYKEIRETGLKGKTFRSDGKKSLAEELIREGKVRKIGEKYYSSDIDLSSIASRHKQPTYTKQSIHEEIQKTGLKGKTFSSEKKKSLAEELIREGKVRKIGEKYYSSDIDLSSIDPKRTIYKEIRETGLKGKTFRSEKKKSLAEDLIREGKVRKIGEKYYSSDIDLSSIASRHKQPTYTKQSIHEEIQKTGLKGKTFRSDGKKSLAEELIREGKVKNVRGKYYSSDIDLDFVPLEQKGVIQRLLDLKTLEKSGKKYIFTEKIRLLREPSVQPKLSFSEFLETVQDLYLREAGHYRESVRLTPLINSLISRLGIPRDLAEKLILELPKIFIGVVDLRPFTGEHGIMLKNGTEVTRIYLSRELVGL